MFHPSKHSLGQTTQIYDLHKCAYPVRENEYFQQQKIAKIVIPFVPPGTVETSGKS